MKTAPGRSERCAAVIEPPMASTKPPDQHRRPGRSVLCGVIEEIEQDLLEQHRIELKHWQVFSDVDLHAVVDQDFNLIMVFLLCEP